MDYNEHYYFETLEEALEKFNEIKQEIIDNYDIEETYTDDDDVFYIQESDGNVKVYIQEI
jgi:succinate dehydrogenase/fumarate reductase flavoprotein subunit